MPRTRIEDMPRDENGRVAPSPSQAAVLEAIREHIATHGWAPTTEDIAKRLGWATRSYAAECLDKLELKGWITRGAGPRAIRITTEGDACSAARVEG